MPPFDYTVFVYGNTSDIQHIIQWLETTRMSFVKMSNPRFYTPSRHEQIIKTSKTNSNVYIFIGQYSQNPLYNLQSLQTWFKHKRTTLTKQLANMNITNNSTNTICEKVPKSYGVCSAKNIKDNQQCSYTATCPNRLYCGSHYKCSLKRLCIYIYKSNENLASIDELGSLILNIFIFNEKETLDFTMSISNPTTMSLTSVEQDVHRRFLNKSSRRPLIIAGSGNCVKAFNTPSECYKWAYSIPSLVRCCFVSGDKSCDNLAKHDKTVYCKDHIVGGNLIITYHSIKNEP
jgi:hypothetical protein